jgi:hypothetical protein
MPPNDTKLHLIAEAVAVFIITPILFHIARNQTNRHYKIFLYLLAIGTLIVDGYLLLKYESWNL